MALLWNEGGLITEWSLKPGYVQKTTFNLFLINKSYNVQLLIIPKFWYTIRSIIRPPKGTNRYSINLKIETVASYKATALYSLSGQGKPFTGNKAMAL